MWRAMNQCFGVLPVARFLPISFFISIILMKAIFAETCNDRTFEECPEGTAVMMDDRVTLNCLLKQNKKICAWQYIKDGQQQSINIDVATDSYEALSKDSKDCSLAIKKAADKDSTQWRCCPFIEGMSNVTCSPTIRLQVATPLLDENVYILTHSNHTEKLTSKGSTKGVKGPGKAPLKADNTPEIKLKKEHDNSEVVCVVYDASLTPTAAFYIDDDYIGGQKMEKLNEPNDQKEPERSGFAYTTSLIRKWSEHDNGKLLKCRVSYDEALKLNQNAEAVVYINIEYAPYLPKNYFHVQSGKTEKKVIEIKSNPALTEGEVTLKGEEIEKGLNTNTKCTEGDTCEIQVTVDATSIQQETYWNLTIEAQGKKLPVYIHIAEKPDNSKTKGGTKGGTKGESDGHRQGKQRDFDNGDDDKDDNDEDNKNALIVVIIIVIVLLIIAGITAYVLYKKKKNKEDSTVETAALYKGKKKDKKDFQVDLSVIPEESQRDPPSKSEPGVGGYQEIPEQGEVNEREIVAKPSPHPRSRIEQDEPAVIEVQTETK